MRILIISDIHANLVALDAVLSAAGEVDAVWNLGDTVGYGPRPRECIEKMQALGADPVLTGNHDLAAIGAIDTSTFNAAARLAAEWTGRQLDDEHRTYLTTRSPLVVYGDITLAHGSPRSPIWEYVVSDDAATENFAHFDTPVCLVGHTHVASFAERAGDAEDVELFLWADGVTLDVSQRRWLINPGSVGQPRDRDPRAAYAILNPGQGTISAHRTPYNIPLTQAQMVEAGLPESLSRRLAVGQ